MQTEADMRHLFVVWILLGLYLASFVQCLRWLVFEDEGWKIRKKINRFILTTVVSMLIASLVIFMERGCLVLPAADVPPEMSMLESQVPLIYGLKSQVIFLLIDILLIHRCWVVFSKSWRIVFLPLLAGSFCLALSFAIALADAPVVHLVTSPPSFGSTDLLVSLFYTGNLILCAYTTVALARPLLVARPSNGAGSTRSYTFYRILTESGIVYSLSMLLYISVLAAYFSRNRDAYTWLSVVVSPLINLTPGIAFHLILIGIREQRVSQEESS